MNNSTPPPTPETNQAQPAKTRIEDDVAIRMLIPIGRSPWALAAGYLGILSLIILPAPIALIVSMVAIHDLRKSRDTETPKRGMGRAVFGLIMGILGTTILLIGFLNMLINS